MKPASSTPAPTPPDHTGQCRCGAVKLRAKGSPLQVSYCHCRDCRRATSAPVSVFVGFETPQIVSLDAAPSYRQGPVTRQFCAACGTPVAYVDDRLQDQVWFMLGFLDAPELYVPQLHGFVETQLAWLHIEDDLPRQDGFTINRPAGT